MKKMIALSLLASLGFLSTQVRAVPLEVGPNTCHVTIYKNNGQWDVRAIVNNEGQETPTIRRGKLKLAKAQPLEKYGYKMLDSENGDIKLIGSVSDGGAEDGKPRVLGGPIIFVGVDTNSCTNATINFAQD